MISSAEMHQGPQHMGCIGGTGKRKRRALKKDHGKVEGAMFLSLLSFATGLPAREKQEGFVFLERSGEVRAGPHRDNLAKMLCFESKAYFSFKFHNIMHVLFVLGLGWEFQNILNI